MKSTFPTSAYFPLPGPHSSTVNPAAYSPSPSYVEPPSYHEVEPRSSSTVPRPFTIDGDTLPSQGWSTSTMPTTTAAAGARPRSTYVLSHDPNELEFPSTLEILWDRTPLHAPIIVPHDRLLPSLWVSRQTMITLGDSLPYLGGGGRDSRREGKQQDQCRQLGLLVGRASFPGRALGKQEHDGSSNRVPPTFMADARPVVCLDLFDPGCRLAKINEPTAIDDKEEGEEGEDREEGEEEMLVPSNETLFNTKRNVVEIVVTRNSKAASTTTTSTTTTSSTSTSTSTSTSNVAIASKTLRAQVVALTEACSSGSVQCPRRASPTTGTMVETDVLHVPGSGLWSIVCTVGDGNEGNNSSSSSSSAVASAAGVSRAMPVKFSVVMPAISLGFTMIQSLPLVTSPMTSQLLHGGTNTHTTTKSSRKHGEFEHGLLTLNQVRRAVPILSDDPLIHRLPMIGAWIQLPLDTFQVLQQTAMTTTMAAASLNRNEPTPPSLQRVLTDPAVWSACCRYLYDPCLTRATSGADVNHFLLAVFPTKVTRPGTPRSPIFLEVSVLTPLGKEEDSSSSSSSSNRRQKRTYNGRPSMPVVRNLNLLFWRCHKFFILSLSILHIYYIFLFFHGLFLFFFFFFFFFNNKQNI